MIIIYETLLVDFINANILKIIRIFNVLFLVINIIRSILFKPSTQEEGYGQPCDHDPYDSETDGHVDPNVFIIILVEEGS